MKHFMLPRNTFLRENQHHHHNEAAPASSPNPKSQSSGKSAVTPSGSKKPKRSSSSKENADPNSMSPAPPSSSFKSPLPPRPPPPNSLKRKLNVESAASAAADCRVRGDGGAGCSDSGVKVIVRMRPPSKNEEEGELIVQKISNNTLTIAGHSFTFDSIADHEATQVDVFQLVGAPLVENCLAGFNSSVFAYGQTGSGKTYTIWGPANALLEDNILNDQQGLTPRILQRLFERISEEQTKHTDKQLIYQCRCSFLEIYNEQITDLLDPTQKNLQIREDVKTGVYVEDLTEEHVSTTKDVRKLLIKGLSNRRTGATSMNAESSRSHSVFTCVVESRCKSIEGGLSCLKKSRINLVDLAGSERQKMTGASGERLKEAGNINRSLSQLGNLINILAEVSQTGKQRHIPYRDSKLTFLLQESLGGNAKLAMVCAISPVQSCRSETFSTLRFAQRAKAIKNKAIVNEEMADDVNVLREVIRQLKEELVRMKTNGNQTDANANFSSRWNARRSLNLLKFSLNHPLILPHVDDDSDEEMEIVNEELEENAQHLLELGTSDERINVEPHPRICGRACAEQKVSEDTDVYMDEAGEQADKDEMNTVDFGEIEKCPKTDLANHRTKATVSDLRPSSLKIIGNDSCGQPIEEATLSSSVNTLLNTEQCEKDMEHPAEQISADVLMGDTPTRSEACLENGGSPTYLNIAPSDVSPILKPPAPSISPPLSNSNWRSLTTSSSLTATQESDTKLESDAACLSFAKPSNSICLNSSLTQRRKISSIPTEYLAASLHRGLEIIDSYRKSAALRRSSFRFSCKPSDIKAIIPLSRVDVGVQTLLQGSHVLEDDLSSFLCSKCKTIYYQDKLNASEAPNMQLVPVDGPDSCDEYKNQVPRAVEKVLAGAIRREMALEEICAQQNTEIMQLNRLVQQYKHERECNAIISQTKEDKIVRLESLMDGILPSEEFMDDEMLSLVHEHKLLKEKYENHPEVSRVKIELKRVQDELDRYRNFLDMGERDVLLEEIQDLRTQLQSYVDSSIKLSKKQSAPLTQLSDTSEPSVAPPLPLIPESMEEIVVQRLEQERIKWTETESKWISLLEELRLELDASRKLAEKQKQELDMERKCSEELKEAMRLAMEGHAKMLEQYAELEEKHMELLVRHRKIQDGIEDVKKAAAKAGVRGVESKFINALAAEISAMKVERENERRYFRDENKGLQAQLRDTAEAVQAAGELLVRLKEAEEAIAAAEKRAIEAEQETEKAYKQIDKLKRKHEKEISALNHQLPDSGLPKEASKPVYVDCNMASEDADETQSTDDHQQGKYDFEPTYNAEEEELKLGEPSSWFSGYDRCNI